METVLEMLQRIAGPIIFVIGLSVFYLLSDDISSYILAVKSDYLNSYTYSEKKVEAVPEKEYYGSDILALLADSTDEGVVYTIYLRDGMNKQIQFKSTNLGWETKIRNAVLSGIPSFDEWGTITYEDALQILKSYSGCKFVTQFNYGSQIGLTSAIFSYPV